MGEHVLHRPSKLLLDWEGAHLFLELVRFRSFRAAAEHLGMSVNALRPRITAFEQSLGTTLVTRNVDGVRPTPEGQKVFNIAAQMEQMSYTLVHSCRPSERALTGQVRLAVTEGIGSLWIGSKLVEFQRANPKLMIDVRCAMRSADVLQLETDISIQLTRPVIPDLKTVKLGRLHLIFFAAQSYLDTYGAPKDVADLCNHRVVVQGDDDPEWHKLYDHLFPGLPAEGLVSLRSNASSVHYWSIAQGAGIGMLPTYVYAVGSPVIPLNLPVHHYVDIWMTYHPSVSRIPRVRRLIDWLIRAFSPRTFPWFRDEYIAPTDLRREYGGRALKNPFEGLGGAHAK
jgi:DNA-binding transcriptional LysR family regulator